MTSSDGGEAGLFDDVMAGLSENEMDDDCIWITPKLGKELISTVTHMPSPFMTDWLSKEADQPVEPETAMVPICVVVAVSDGSKTDVSGETRQILTDPDLMDKLSPAGFELRVLIRLKELKTSPEGSAVTMK
jgi:hypothetical protein